jgi:hypothetical protein
MRVLKAGLIYFLLVLAVGWILGPVRELWVVPRIGRTAGMVLEAIILLIAMTITARWVIRRFDVQPRFGSTISMGLVALGILLPAELAGVVWVGGRRDDVRSSPERGRIGDIQNRDVNPTPPFRQSRNAKADPQVGPEDYHGAQDVARYLQRSTAPEAAISGRLIFRRTGRAPSRVPASFSRQCRRPGL